MNLNPSPRGTRWAPFAILAGLTILLMILDSTGNIDRLFGFLTNPMTVLLEWTAARSDAFASVLAGPRDLQTARVEIEALQASVTALEAENERLRRIETQYRRLEALLETPDLNAVDPNTLSEVERTLLALRQTFETSVVESQNLTRISAAVIARGTNNFFRDIIINRGFEEGVRAGMPVESAEGLVGQVYRTTQHSAQVILITDGLSKIPVRLADSRATGLLSGGGVGGLVVMDWIDLEAQLAPGDQVITSGLEGITPQERIGNRFPQNIVVGQVVEVQSSEAELFQRALVQPAVAFDSLEVVFVITDFTPIDITVFDEQPTP